MRVNLNFTQSTCTEIEQIHLEPIITLYLIFLCIDRMPKQIQCWKTVLNPANLESSHVKNRQSIARSGGFIHKVHSHNRPPTGSVMTRGLCINLRASIALSRILLGSSQKKTYTSSNYYTSAEAVALFDWRFWLSLSCCNLNPWHIFQPGLSCANQILNKNPHYRN